jgi:hypothetical protein
MTYAESDDEFDAIVAGLVLDEPSDVLRVDELDNLSLVRRYEQLRQLLLESGEMLSDIAGTPRSTQEGRDLHSERVAILVEMTKRGLR